jgi:Cu(I)/Ag(I) efflux system membrane protein CusA/SilA
LVTEAAMNVANRVDEILRDLATRRLAEFRPELGHALAGEAVDALLGRVDPAAVARPPMSAERDALVASLAKTYGDRLAIQVLPDDVTSLVNEAAKRLIELRVFRDRADLLTPPPSLLERASDAAGDVLGLGKPTLFSRIADHLVARHEHRLKERMKTLNWEIFDRAVGVTNWAALDELTRLGRDRKLAARDVATEELPGLRAELDKPFADRLLLWQKTKQDLVEEMSTVLQMPGWGNSFTQPIANRIEMLSTGVRLPVAVKVFGSKLDEIQRVSLEIAGVLRTVRGAADVFPDQITGKGYVEIRIDRKKAARYGINVGDVQDVIETAMGGPRLSGRREGAQEHPRLRPRDGRRCGTSRWHERRYERRDGPAPTLRRRHRPGPARPGAAGRRGRRAGGRGTVDDQERERPAPRLHPAPRS